ncbi:MAG: methyltransferase domain-containing protein [Planctomycetaceae bacterium]
MIVSYEESVHWLRSQQEYSELVIDAYLDRDNISACTRFLQSAEFLESMRLLGVADGGGSTVIDLGAGNGIASIAFAKRGLTVTAVEPNESADVGAGAIRRAASSLGLSIEVLTAVGEQFPCASCQFDAAYCRQVLHHASDLGQMVKEVYRVLKPGGRFLAVREHVVDDEEQLQAFLNAHPLHHLHGGENAYSESVYLRTFEDAGFVVRDVLTRWSSVICSFPQPVSLTHERMIAYYRQRLGAFRSLAALVARVPVIQRRFAQAMAASDKLPGRLYGFLCMKPHSSQGAVAQ